MYCGALCRGFLSVAVWPVIYAGAYQRYAAGYVAVYMADKFVESRCIYLEPFDLLIMVAAVVIAIFLFLVFTFLIGRPIKEGVLRRDRSIQNGTVTKAKLTDVKFIREHEVRQGKWNKSWYKARYEWMINGKSYHKVLRLYAYPSDEITIYYDKENPRKYVTSCGVEHQMGVKFSMWAILPVIFCCIVYWVLKYIIL